MYVDQNYVYYLIVSRLFGLVFAVDGAFVALFALHFDVERPLRTSDSDGKLACARAACLHDEVRFEPAKFSIFLNLYTFFIDLAKHK